MIDRWYYLHDNRKQGPVSAEDILVLAAEGKLMPFDLLWPDGVDSSRAIEARSAIDFTALARPDSAAPPEPALEELPEAELDESASADRTEPPPAEAAPALPDWLSDVQRLEAAAPPRPPQPPAPAKPARKQPKPKWLSGVDPAAPAAAAQGRAPDWLDDLRRTEAAEAPKSLPDSMSPTKQANRIFESEEMIAALLLNPDATPAAAPPPAAPLAPEPVLEAIPVNEPAAATAETPAAPEPPAVPSPTLSSQEAFQKARAALHRWVDLPKNEEILMHNSRDAVVQHPDVKRLLAEYRHYGLDMQRRLREDLERLVDNRKKFYASRR
jgi:hypothetical protein